MWRRARWRGVIFVGRGGGVVAGKRPLAGRADLRVLIPTISDVSRKPQVPDIGWKPFEPACAPSQPGGAMVKFEARGRRLPD